MSLTSWHDISSKVRTRFQDQVVTGLSLTTAWPNAKFEVPDPTAKLTQQWCRVSVVPVSSVQVATGGPGGNRYRHSGILVVQIFTPPDVGDGRGLSLAASISSRFRSGTHDEVVYTTPQPPVPVGIVQGWYQHNLNCPFYADTFS